MKKCTASIQTESAEITTPTTSHDSAQHTMVNAPLVEVWDTGQNAAEKQNILRKLGDKTDIIGANPVTSGIITKGDQSTGGKGNIYCIDIESDEEDYV